MAGNAQMEEEIKLLRKLVKAQEKVLVAYRLKRAVLGNVLDTIRDLKTRLGLE